MSDGLSIVRVVPAEIERVFDAWARAELLARWFGCSRGWSTRVECDCVVGGSYRIEMRDGERTMSVAHGRYLQVERPNRLVFSWSSEGQVNVPHSVVSLQFRALGAHTELTLSHDLQPETELAKAHARGWRACLDGLGSLLTTQTQTGEAR
jgi:uncharacterized protein YndB with AHSA1/START domain